MRYTTSRIAIAAAMAAGVAVAMAGPVFADVTVVVDVDKTKIITVTETITINKEVTIRALFNIDLDGAAEAQALANVLNQDNDVNLSFALNDALMNGSVNDNTGITEVNQAAGNMPNQGSLVALALADTGQSFVNSQAEVDQVNTSLVDTPASVINLSALSATMGGSVKDNTGVTQVNQDSGNMNNQTNAVAVAAGIELGDNEVLVALAEGALGQTTSDHSLTVSASFQTASMTGSVAGNVGVTQVSSSAGNFGNQANVVSVSTAITP